MPQSSQPRHLHLCSSGEFLPGSMTWFLLLFSSNEDASKVPSYPGSFCSGCRDGCVLCSSQRSQPWSLPWSFQTSIQLFLVFLSCPSLSSLVSELSPAWPDLSRSSLSTLVSSTLRDGNHPMKEFSPNLSQCPTQKSCPDHRGYREGLWDLKRTS